MAGIGSEEIGAFFSGARRPAAGESAGVGVVVIGLNEGERLRRCLESVRGQAGRVVYVDSGSTDGSPAAATAMGVDVVELDPSLPFSAARARNTGLDRLQKISPGVEFVLFVDGDCEVAESFLPAGSRALRADARVAAVAGRLPSGFPHARSTTGCATWNGTCRPALPRVAAASPSFAWPRSARRGGLIRGSWPGRSRSCACGCGSAAGPSSGSPTRWPCTTRR